VRATHTHAATGFGLHGVEYHVDSHNNILKETLEHRMGVEPMNNGFAGRRVSHFATCARIGLR
jgi:hypothetical protein